MVLVLGKIRYEPQGRKTNDKHMFQGDRKMLLERPPKYIILKWGHLSVRGNGKNYFLNVTLLFYSSLPSSFKGKVESKYFLSCFLLLWNHLGFYTLHATNPNSNLWLLSTKHKHPHHYEPPFHSPKQPSPHRTITHHNYCPPHRQPLSWFPA